VNDERRWILNHLSRFGPKTPREILRAVRDRNDRGIDDVSIGDLRRELLRCMHDGIVDFHTDGSVSYETDRHKALEALHALVKKGSLTVGYDDESGDIKAEIQWTTRVDSENYDDLHSHVMEHAPTVEESLLRLWDRLGR